MENQVKISDMRKPYYFLLSLILLIGAAFTPVSRKATVPIYLNTSYSFEERATDLVSRMTLEEKQSLLGNTMSPVPRLGINKYDVWGEALHGIMGRNNNSGKTATSFPNSNAVGNTWDPELLEREASVIADEARAFNHDLIFTLTYWSPVIEPARDPRWGRTAETFAEDPFLVAQMGSGFVRGMMGDDPRYLKTVPTGKHYIANNTEFNRHTGSSDMDNRDMREFYLSTYRSIIEKDKLPSIMTAYNAVNGVPVSTSTFLVDTIARRTFGMKGYVTGDCGAITDIWQGHKYVSSGVEATALGLIAGVDSDCGGEYQVNTIEALKRGLISEADIDRALINMFTIRMRLGEFDPQPMVPYSKIRPEVINDPLHNELALIVATKSPVLFKNDVSAKYGSKALPLNTEKIKTIAVLGPYADKMELGDYSGPVEPRYVSTPLKAIREYLGAKGSNIEVIFGEGGNTEKRNDFFTLTGFTLKTKSGAETQFNASEYDESAPGIFVTERFGGKMLRGVKNGDWTAYHGIDVTELDSITFNASVSLSGGTVEVRVNSPSGNILVAQKLEAAGQGGFFGQRATVTAKLNTLGITGPQDLYFVYREPESELDPAVIETAAKADVALIFVGTDQNTGREEADRFSIALPGNQLQLIKEVAAVNPNTIVIMQTMGMVEVEDFKNDPNIPAIIYTGYNGQAQGAAMAKILFGEVNPGGKTAVTWYKSVNDLPDFNDYNLRGQNGSNGRTYWYFDKEVSYEFGFGLSYTSFAYDNFKICSDKITPNSRVVVSVDVTNTGKVDGDEVVQVYVRTPDSKAELQRPIKRLKGFRRVTIPAGQTKTVEIVIDCADLWFWDDAAGSITFDQGRYVFEIGASSKDIRGTVEAIMEGQFKAELKTVVARPDRFILTPGQKAVADFSACLNNDRFLNNDEVSVSYKSNDPSVVKVDDKGNITAIKPGVATVTVSVSYDGNTVSDSFALKVRPDLSAAGIKVNGKALKGFNNSTKAYSFLMKKNAKVPQVEASAKSKDVSVEIEQARAIPGTAVVRFIDYNTYEEDVYLISFDYESVSDEFNGSAPGSQWQWLRENESNHSIGSGSLTITTENGDISEGSNSAKNLLLQSANNDWTIDTKLVGSRAPSQPENAAIVAYQDDNNFVKLMFRSVIKTTRQRGPQPGTVDLLFEENGIARSVASIDLKQEVVGENPLYLRLTKKGSTYTAWFSRDGQNYELLGSSDILLKDIKAGLMACDGVITQSMTSTYWFDSDTTKPDTPFDVSFDYFRIKDSGL